MLDPLKVAEVVVAVLVLILSGLEKNEAAARVAEEWGLSLEEVKRML